MKKICALLLLLIGQTALAQSGTVGHNPNGLLYTDAVLSKLKHIADSLHVQFQHMPTAVYNSVPQAYYAHHISANQKEALNIKQDIDAGLNYNQIMKKYPGLHVLDSLHAICDTYLNYEQEKVLSLSIHAQGRSSNLIMRFEREAYNRYKNVTNGWFYNYNTRENNTSESISACYITNFLTLIPLKKEYARLVQYSELFVSEDNVFYDDAKNYDIEFPDAPGAEMTAFLDYANAKLGEPYEERDEDYALYYNKWREWQSNKWVQADRLYATDWKFKKLLAEAYTNTLKGTTSTDFEDYLWRYYSKAIALDYKRNRRIFGATGVSLVPGLHMRNIAVLAAETTQWDVFMCAHLTIVDTDFEDADTTDTGEVRRHTYIKELEKLDINIGDLLIGISLKIDNVPESHYYGDINDIGKLVYEAKDREKIAARLLAMIQDTDLDVHNRIRMCYVYQNYNYYLNDVAKRNENKAQFNLAVSTLPKGLYEGFINKDNPRYSKN